MIAELEADGPPRDRRSTAAVRRRGRRTRRAAVVAALALGAALIVQGVDPAGDQPGLDPLLPQRHGQRDAAA
ncbi:hypothetical protein, partial [Streptomyces sp. NPDC051162]|uniref:hypothetical protein n=1 Tax=Streptomyces sp. NPDC051162 TaxID=3154747 RepID=UPI003448E106